MISATQCCTTCTVHIMAPAIDRSVTEPEAEQNGSTTEKEIKVLVTGFGPWGKNTVNPSNSVASLLPSHLTPTSSHPGIRLIVHSPIPVSYNHIHSQVPELLADCEPDYVLHMGLHGGRPTFDLELSAPRTGFLHPDFYNKCWTIEEGDKVVPGVSVLPHQVDPTNANANRERGLTKQRVVDGALQWPDRLETRLDRDKIVDLWKRNCADLTGAKVTGNDGVGNYCCAFIYYTSLGYFRRTQGSDSGPVLFLHMPNLRTEDEVEHGRDVVVRLIDAIVTASTKAKTAAPLP